MSNFELIDDYLTNRLSVAEREAFESQLNSNPELKADLDFQSSVIEGVKKARAVELKSMLNNVPITNTLIEVSPLKIAAGLAGIVLVATAMYLYLKESPEIPKIPAPTEDSVSQAESVIDEVIEPVEPVVEKNTISEVGKSKTTQATELSKPSNKISTNEVAKPVLEVVDPSEDLNESTATRATRGTKPASAFSVVEVEIDSSNKKYPFHYQFVNSRVILFGSFDKSLYEILEINGGNRSVFLFYKENYYSLQESTQEIAPLVVIKDKTLIQKLKEYRKN
jgi:hypothetical protein